MKRFDFLIGMVAFLAFILLILQLGSYFNQYLHVIKTVNICILIIFISDVILRYALAKDKKQHLRQHWFDLIVFVPLIQFIKGIQNAPFFVFIWQVVIVTMVLSRVKRANKFISLLSLRPAQLMVTSFFFAIGVGTILLMLPVASNSGEKTSLIDALFTATSATCVTGLIVKDTATYFSVFGQTVVLALIQIGGLGIMTFSVSLALLFKKSIDMQRQVVMHDVLDQDVASSIKDFIMFIFKMTFLFEFIGALTLFIAWRDRFPDIIERAYYACFHSISAYCNAGFSTFSDSLTQFLGDIPTNVAISLLIILGGLGFVVIKDVTDNVMRRFKNIPKKSQRLRMQTKVVLVLSALLIIVGAVSFYALEHDQAFASLSAKDKVCASLFQSITTRTAGFNSCDIAGLSSASVFIMIILMFIGGSPGSTAGGVKTTTVAVLWAILTSGFRRREDIECYGRKIPYEVIQKAISVFMMSLLVVIVFLVMMLMAEKKFFVDILFETVSAFGTVGLSTGITAELSEKGKFIITLLMFIGRLGPLTIGFAFMKYRKPVRYEYAEERLMIG